MIPESFRRIVSILFSLALVPCGLSAADTVVSLNFHRGTSNGVMVNGSYGAEVLGSVAGNWNNFDNAGSGTDLLDHSGSSTSVDLSSTGFFQFQAEYYPENVDYSSGGRFNATALRAGPPTTSAGDPITVTLSDLNATFPNGYKVAVFLTGRSDNPGASISDGTTTYFFRGPADNILKNGDFEETTGTGDKVPYSQVPNWENAGSGGDQVLLRNTEVLYGTYSGNLAEAASRLLSQQTSHVISNGDTFTASWAWREGFQWTKDDEVQIRLFYTDDNTVGGTQTEVASFTDKKGLNGSFKVTSAGPSDPAADVPAGRILFVQVDTIDGAGGPDGFAFIDNIIIGLNSRTPGPNQKITTDTGEVDGIDPANLAIFGSDAAPLTEDSLTLTLEAFSEGVAALGGLQIVSASQDAGPTSLLSCSLYSGPGSTEIIEFGETWGLGADGSPAASPWWNNLRYTVDIGPSGIPLRYSNGVASSVTCIPTDSDGNGLYDPSWGSEGVFPAVWNDTVLRAGRATYATANPVQYDLSNLLASFPFGYQLIVYLTGYNSCELASITDGTTTYYFEVDNTGLGDPAVPRRSTLTDEPAVGAAPPAEYVVFGTESAPLIEDNLTLTLAKLDDPGGVALAGFQIIGNELEVDIASLVAGTMGLTVGNIPPGLSLEVRKSADLASGFVPLDPAVTFDSTTLQPINVPVDTGADSKGFVTVAPVLP